MALVVPAVPMYVVAVFYLRCLHPGGFTATLRAVFIPQSLFEIACDPRMWLALDCQPVVRPVVIPKIV